ncbi:c-type cytochrome domain-containing protein [Fimbriiglobus ruber]|uniref:Planctomycete cytochrome C n=1 Tax=Fimbriiglobus ruber TaxID=1908690 RepID=A0A225DZC5_9BACT|nr:c-type cytochrome domain-containing protein [Fimbriiglobus ruber]OWK41715.1 Planctomycete cytochrome C [Fimbriiglobus ruber]
MRRLFRFLAPVVALLAYVPAALADAKKPTFDEDVVPVLKQHCMGCHGNDKQKGGLNVATFAAAMQGGSSGAVVIPGDPDKSRLYALTAHKEEPKMPPNAARIPEAQLEILRLWIEQGGRENTGSKAVVSAKPKVDIGLKSVGKGKPEGPPPMPQPGALKADPVTVNRRPNAVLALAASPWAPLLAVGGQKQIILYHADTGDLLGVLPFEHGQINSLKFSRNAKFLLAAGGRGGASGRAVLYNIETGAKVTEVGASETDAILAADISADQTMIAVGTPTRMIRIYSIADGSVLNSIKKHTDWVTAVEFSPDGVLLATGDRNGGLFVWEANTAREFHTLRGHTAMITDVSWRADSNVVASASEDGTVRLWEMENGGQIKNWAAHPGGVESVRVAHDGRVVSTGRDKLTKLWDGNGGLQKQFEAFADLGLRVAVTHDGGKVVGGDWSGALKVWAAADAKTVAVLDTNPLPLADQVKQTEAVVAAAEAKAKGANDVYAAAAAKAKMAVEAYAATQANATKVSTELAVATKATADATAAATATTPQVTTAKAEMDKWATAVAAATNKMSAYDVTVPATVEAAKKVQDASAKAPQNPDLAAAAKTFATLVQQQQNEVALAKKVVTDAVAAHKVAADKHAALVKVVNDNQTTAAEAQKKAAVLQPMVKPATDAVAPAKTAADAANAAVAPVKAAADAANAELAAAKAKLDRLKGVKKVAAK